MSGVPQYLRQVSLLVGDTGGKAIDLSSLRIAFKISRGNIQTPNSARIRVYNVAPATIAQLQAPKEFGRVVLQAGYQGNFGVIFDGTVKQVRVGRESQTDTYVDITAADGDSAYNFSFIGLSLAAGSKPSDHVAAVAQTMSSHGVTQGYIPDLGGNPLPRGKVLYGMPRDHLRRLAQSTGTDWSIQDGQLQLVPQSAYMPGDVPVINAQTGMIGLPEQTDNGIKVSMLLNPSIKVNGRIQLNNNSIQKYEYSLDQVNGGVQNNFVQTYSKLNPDGMYKPLIVEHMGDTRGEDWQTDVICLSIDLTTSPGLNDQSKGAPAPAGPVKPYG